MNYFITFNDECIGPMSKEQVVSYPVTPNTPVCTVNYQVWQPLYNFPELMELLTESAAKANALEINTTGKSKIVCGILAILLGGLGIQYFYIGKIAAGFISIILLFVTCGLWKIVALVQGIVMLTMTQSQFEQKYVLNPSPFPVF